MVMGNSYHMAPASNAVMLAAFAALIPINIYNGIRYKTPTYALLLGLALVVEIIGHVGRFLLSSNSTTNSHIILYMLGTHWGPIFLGSGIYLILPHVTVIYGQQFRLVTNGIYLNILFVVLDIFASIFQSAGIVSAVNSSSTPEIDQGIIIMLVGLSIHATTIATFLGTYWHFRYRLSHREYILDDRFSHIYLSTRFRYFLIGAQAAAALLLLRATLRIIAISGTFSSTFSVPGLATSLLDDILILLAFLILSVLPVGRAFSRSWAETSPLVSPDALSDLPLRRYFHWHTNSTQIHNRHISYPYPSNTTAASSPFTPGYTYTTAPAELPAYSEDNMDSAVVGSPLTSPRHNPVYQRAPYDQSPAQTVPFLPHGGGVMQSPTGFVVMDHRGERRRDETNKMVERDHLWR